MEDAFNGLEKALEFHLNHVGYKDNYISADFDVKCSINGEKEPGEIQALVSKISPEIIIADIEHDEGSTLFTLSVGCQIRVA